MKNIKQLGFFPLQCSFLIEKEQCAVFPTRAVLEIMSPCKKKAQENNLFQLHKSAPQISKLFTALIFKNMSNYVIWISDFYIPNKNS